MNIALNAQQTKKFFSIANLIQRQLLLDSLELDHIGFDVKRVDLNNSNFNLPDNKIDVKKLEQILQWLRQQLDWLEDDLKIIKTGEIFQIQSKDPEKLIHFMTLHDTP